MIQVKFDIQVLQLISEAVSNFGIDTQIGTRDIRQISNGSKKIPTFLQSHFLIASYLRNGKEKAQYRPTHIVLFFISFLFLLLSTLKNIHTHQI
jgi:hypothetical protein